MCCWPPALKLLLQYYHKLNVQKSCPRSSEDGMLQKLERSLHSLTAERRQTMTNDSNGTEETGQFSSQFVKLKIFASSYVWNDNGEGVGGVSWASGHKVFFLGCESTVKQTMEVELWLGAMRVILLWLEISVNYAQVVQMVEGQCQLCKVEFHIFLCKHNLIRTGQIYSLHLEEERSTAANKTASSTVKLQSPESCKYSIIVTFQQTKRLSRLLIWHCQQLSLWFWDMLSTQDLSGEQSHNAWVPWQHLKEMMGACFWQAINDLKAKGCGAIRYLNHDLNKR